MSYCSTLHFDKAKAEAFRAAYKQAVADKQDTFVFDDKEVLVPYAKFLCEYLVLRGLLDKEEE